MTHHRLIILCWSLAIGAQSNNWRQPTINSDPANER